MPASTQAIIKNVERKSGDTELTELGPAAKTEHRTTGQAWIAFIEAADAAKIADRIPGSVGRQHRARYAESPSTKEAVATVTTRQAAAKKTKTPKVTTTRKAAATKKAAK